MRRHHNFVEEDKPRTTYKSVAGRVKDEIWPSLVRRNFCSAHISIKYYKSYSGSFFPVEWAHVHIGKIDIAGSA